MQDESSFAFMMSTFLLPIVAIVNSTAASQPQQFLQQPLPLCLMKRFFSFARHVKLPPPEIFTAITFAVGEGATDVQRDEVHVGIES